MSQRERERERGGREREMTQSASHRSCQTSSEKPEGEMNIQLTRADQQSRGER